MKFLFFGITIIYCVIGSVIFNKLPGPTDVQHILITHPLTTRGGDANEYAALAESLILQRNFFTNGIPDTFRTPVYPAFIAFLFFIFHHVGAIIVAQIFLVLSTGYIIFLLSNKWLNAPWSLGVAAAYLLNPTTIITAMSLITETVFIFLFFLTLFMFLEKKRYVCAGVIFGLCILTRPVALYILPLITIIFLYTEVSRKKIVVFLCATLCVAGMWSVRNKVVASTWGLSSVSSYNLLQYNLSGYESDVMDISFNAARVLLENQSGVNAQGARYIENAHTIDTFAKQFIKNHFFSYLKYHTIKTIPFFISSDWRYAYASYQSLLAESETAILVGNISSMLFHGQVGTALGEFKKYNKFVIFDYAIYVVIGSLFLFGIARNNKKRSMLLVVASIIFFFAFVTGPVFNPRYRLPALPFMLFGAALVLQKDQKKFDTQDFHG